MIQTDLGARQVAYDAWKESQAQGTDLPLEPPPRRWQLMIGDGLHNLRSSLDHLVFGLAARNDRPCEDAAFPIHSVDDEAAKRAFTTQVEPFVSKEAAALIESFQPYHGYDGTDADSLLQRISAVPYSRQHRELSPAGHGRGMSGPCADFTPAAVMEFPPDRAAWSLIRSPQPLTRSPWPRVRGHQRAVRSGVDAVLADSD